MSTAPAVVAESEPALGTIIAAYNEVTERLKQSHDRLAGEVRRLRVQLDQKNRELARRERLAALGEMAAGVAHEIRNPLSGINLYASVLCQDLHDRPNCRNLAERIVSGVRALDGVVGDILAFAGQTPIHLRPVSVAEVVATVVELVEPERRATGVSLHVDESVAGALVEADLNQLQRALLNITLNAIDATGEAGNVWISVSLEDGGASTSIEIGDDGPGIDAAARDRMFNPFFTTKETGTGLGLAIVHRIAEAHGGRVRADNRPEGGARFQVVLRSALGDHD
jgi:signal transduction histidine kinase